jgi:hypothetical protein
MRSRHFTFVSPSPACAAVIGGPPDASITTPPASILGISATSQAARGLFRTVAACHGLIVATMPASYRSLTG